MLSEGSTYAFQLLFDRHKNHIYKVATRYVKAPAMAEEIVQDVFMKVWISRETLSGLHSFEAWLFTVSRNLIFNYNRRLAVEWKANQKYKLDHRSNIDNTDHKIREAQYRQLLKAAQEQLSDQQVTIYRMAKESGMSYKEIAEQLNISPLTVKTHLARAVNSIKAYLRQHGEVICLVLFILGK